tara:strand:- start:132 stop:395 length:264 start_codon:yes stop_codon:yes gene_type:complete
MFKLPLMITCGEIEAFIMDYLDGSLPTNKRAVFKMHLFLCKDCQRYLAAYERSVALGKAAFDDPNDPVRADVPEDLVQAILAAKKAK